MWSLRSAYLICKTYGDGYVSACACVFALLSSWCAYMLFPMLYAIINLTIVANYYSYTLKVFVTLVHSRVLRVYARSARFLSITGFIYLFNSFLFCILMI